MLRADDLRDVQRWLQPPVSGDQADWTYDEDWAAARSRHAGSPRQHPRLSIPAITTGTYTVVIPVYVPSAWAIEPRLWTDPENGVTKDSIAASKFLQLLAIQGPDHYVEVRMQTFGPDPARGWKSRGFRGGCKVYGDLGPGAYRGAHKTYGAGSDSAQPMQAPLAIFYDRLTYFVAHVELQAQRVEEESLTVYDLFSLWTVDQPRGVKLVYDRIPIAHVAGYVGPWLQFGGEHRPADPELYRYVPWVLQLQGAPIGTLLGDIREVGFT